MKIIKRLVKIAHSFGVIINKDIIKKLGLKKGDYIEIEVRSVK